MPEPWVFIVAAVAVLLPIAGLVGLAMALITALDRIGEGEQGD